MIQSLNRNNLSNGHKSYLGSLLAELSVLHELSALVFADSEEQLAVEAVEKATRLFSVIYFAAIYGQSEQQRLVASFGFRSLKKALAEIKKYEHDPRALKLVFNKESDDQVIIFLMHSLSLDDRARRLCTIFAQRLVTRMAAFRSLEKTRHHQDIIEKSEERAKAQRMAIAELALDPGIDSGDFTASIQKITEVVSNTLRVDRASIWLLSDDGSRFECCWLYESCRKKISQGKILITKEFPRYFQAILTDSRINANDAQADPRTCELTQNYLVPLGITSLLDAAIQKNGKLAGVFSLEHTGVKRKWHPDEEAFASTAAALVSQALSNAERKQAMQDLKESGRMLKESQKIAGIGSYTVDLIKDTCKSSETLNDLLGIPQKEKHPMEIWPTLIHPDWREKVMQAHKLAMEKVKMFDQEYKIIRPSDGQERWMHDIGRFELDENGVPIRLIGTIQDITLHKQTENKLNESLSKLRTALGATVTAMAATVEIRDPYTAGHQRRVSDLARAIATEMKLPRDKINGIRTASTIHDLGKISVPAEILSKPSKLTDLEFNLIKTHSQAGYDILKKIEFPWPVARMVLEHHERMDGSGYPNGLTEDKIMIESAIMAVADVVEAMSSFRPYRPALGVDAALKEIIKNKGILYHPDVVDVCLLLFKEKAYIFK
jgi:PAS domain S-box-containing protein